MISPRTLAPRCPACSRGLQRQNGCTFAQRESGPLRIERTTGRTGQGLQGIEAGEDQLANRIVAPGQHGSPFRGPVLLSVDTCPRGRGRGGAGGVGGGGAGRPRRPHTSRDWRCARYFRARGAVPTRLGRTNGMGQVNFAQRSCHRRSCPEPRMCSHRAANQIHSKPRAPPAATSSWPGRARNATGGKF